MEQGTFKILSKDEFKSKLTKYLEDQEERGRNFNEEIKSRPSGLSELFYLKPIHWRTEERRKELKDILTGVEEENEENDIQLKIEREPDEDIKVINFLDKNSEINLYHAIPELKEFFERINSSHFLKRLDGQRTSGRLNILEIFAEKDKSLEDQRQTTNQKLEIAENPEKFEETVQKARDTFKKKMAEHFSREEYVYFFAYTRIETRQNKDKSYTIKVRVPTSEDEISKRNNGSVYILKKFDNEIFPLLDRAIKEETSTQKKYWIREYAASHISIYNQRKGKLGEKEYAKFLQYERNGGEGAPKQGDLFREEDDTPQKSTKMFYEYEGNKGAHSLLSQWLQSQRNTKGPCSGGVILQGEYSEKEQKLLMEYYIQKIKEDLPFLKVEIIDCEQFSNKCQKLFRGENTTEPVNAKWERVDKWVKTILPAHVFVLYNIEKIENKLYSQQKLLQVIQQGGKAKILATSNKRISEFSEAKTTEEGVTEKKGFRGDLLNKIKAIPRSVVSRPQEKECGSLLYNLFKRNHPSIDLPRNLIVGIGKLIQDTSCYDALIEEIMSACEGGTKPFDFNKAKEVVQNRIDAIYNPTLDEIYNTVNKFFDNMDERYKRSDSQLNTMKKKYTAYFAKKLPLPGTSKSYRTQEDIASYIRVTPNTIKSYISEITDIAVYKKGIEDRINELRNTREKIILGLI